MNRNSSSSANTSGSVFLVLFGALGVLGVLGVGMTTFIKGPLTSSVKLTRSNAAQSQMAIAAQTAVMAATGMAGSGDCDADNYIEPVEWRVDASKPKPTGGGIIPLGIGVTRTTDPWGNEYGYCVWDHGPATLNAGCQQGTPGTNRRLAGTSSNLYPVVAIISSGPDKTFTTTCRTFAAADVNSNGVLGDTGDLEMVSKAAVGDDDMIFTYTYEEATGASGGLWQLKSSDPNTATINKTIEAPNMKFSGTSMMASMGANPDAPADCSGAGGSSYYNDATTGHCYFRTNNNDSRAVSFAKCYAQNAYPAVITSAYENNIITTNITASLSSYISGSDSGVEGEWRWDAGPENGTQFWAGGGSSSGGTAYGGAYNNWSGSSQPNTTTAAHDFLMFNTDGQWSAVDGSLARPAICEKSGGAPNLAMQNGLRIADSTVVTTCNSTNTGVLRRTASGANLEMCDGTTWQSGGGTSIGTIIDNLSDGIANYVRNNIFLGQTMGSDATSGGGNVIYSTDPYASATLTTGFGNSAMGKNVVRNISTGSANTVIGAEAMANSPTANRTSAIGVLSCSKLLNGTANNDNTCIGTAALLDKVTTQVTSLGRYSGYNTTGAVRAVWLGGDAGNRNTTGVDNTAIGNYALDAITTGTTSTSFGHASLTSATGNSNTGVGSGAMGSVTTASQNVAIGASALGSHTTSGSNTAIGYNASRLLGAGNNNVAAGYHALYASTAGTENVAIGSYAAASLTNATSSRNVVVGRDALRDKAASTSDNVAIGATAVKGTGSTLNNVGIGWSAGAVLRSPANVAIGYGASRLQNSTTATVINTAVGSGALAANLAQPNNTAVGYQALNKSTATSNSVAIGYETLFSITGTTANNLTAVGYQALRSNTANTFATAVGYQAMYNNVSGGNNTAIGYQALYSSIISANNTAVGSQAFYSLTNPDGQNTAVGYQAGYATAGLDSTVMVGSQAGYGSSSQSAANVVAVGYRSLYSTGAPAISGSTAFGSQALYGGGSYGSAFGFRSAYHPTNEPTAAGYLAFAVTPSGTRNTALGALAMTGGLGTSDYNTAAGYRAMVANANGTGVNSSYNTAIGARALENNGFADNNVAIGYAAFGGTSSNRSTAIGAQTNVSGDNSTAIGYGVSVGAANTIRLGNTSITAIEGQVAWTFPSDRRLKKDITPSDLGLDFIMGLKPVSYRLKQGNGRLDYGFLAQDIETSLDGRETNMLIRLDDTMKTYQLRSNDLIAPVVKAIQERQKKIDDLKRQITELKKEDVNCEEGAE